MARLALISIKYTNVFLTSIEVQPTNWLPIVVIKQYPKVALGITMNNPFRINYSPDNRFDNMEAFQLFERRLNPILPTIFGGLWLGLSLDRRHGE